MKVVCSMTLPELKIATKAIDIDRMNEVHDELLLTNKAIQYQPKLIDDEGHKIVMDLNRLCRYDLKEKEFDIKVQALCHRAEEFIRRELDDV